MKISGVTLCMILMLWILVIPEQAHAAYQALQCNTGQPVAGTSLFDDTNTGACRFTGLQHMFSTVVCQFVSMVNFIMGRLYCSIQAAVTPIVSIVLVLFVVIYGAQILTGTAQLNAKEVISRVIRMTMVLWLVSDPTFGVSAGISYMFNFFISFISDSTRWVLTTLDNNTPIDLFVSTPGDPGIVGAFAFLDYWVYNALTGTFSAANSKVIGFFMAMATAMPSVTMLFLYWVFYLAQVMFRTLLSFLMAVVSVSFLLGLSPIFLSFMLFQVTFQFFDAWLRFMISFSLQVMVSFAILTMWLFSLTLFAPFFNELSDVIYPYDRAVRPATSIYIAPTTWGLCPMTISFSPLPSAKCKKTNFNPIAPSVAGQMGNADYESMIPPSKVPELKEFLFYLFYHSLTLLVVSYGFASLQRNSSDIAKQLAGPSFTAILNQKGIGPGAASMAKSAPGHADKFMSKGLFSGFNTRHEAGKSPSEQMVRSVSQLVGSR